MKKAYILVLSILFILSIIPSLHASPKGSPKGSPSGSYIEKEMKESSQATMNGAINGASKGTLHERDYVPEGVDITIEEADVTANGKVKIEGTASGSALWGEGVLKETDDGLSVSIELYNVPDPGGHGIHIHQYGSCDNEGKEAGGHYNPQNTDHGFFPEHGLDASHPGDMGNIEIEDNGYGQLSVFLPGVSLINGEYNVSGRAVILHAKKDDFGQPTGNAGGRIGCGIIYLTKE